MTRKALLELIQHRLKQVDSTEQFPLLYIEGMCDVVWGSWSSEAVNALNQDANFFTKAFNAVDVTEDVDSGYFFSTLPEQIVKLNRVGDGVMSINQINAKDNDFKPIKERDFRLMKGQEVDRTGSDIYFYVTYDTVFYGNSMTNDIADSGVDMRLAIPFSKYSYSEQLPLPAGKEMEFTEAVINLIIGTPPTNLTNKNSDQ